MTKNMSFTRPTRERGSRFGPWMRHRWRRRSDTNVHLVLPLFHCCFESFLHKSTAWNQIWVLLTQIEAKLARIENLPRCSHGVEPVAEGRRQRETTVGEEIARKSKHTRLLLGSLCHGERAREMGRQPCCEKVGLKKGPSTRSQDSCGDENTTMAEGNEGE